MLLALACTAAFCAGLVDAVAGGGGLIQLPALLVIYPDTPAAILLGTNKASSLAGTTSALLRYARAVPIPWRDAAPAAFAAFLGSFAGAHFATRLPAAAMRPLVIVLLALVAIYTFLRRDLGSAPSEPRARGIGPAVALGAFLGFYDGFFGPGTGSFLLFGFVMLLGLDFLRASASSKLVNFATNIAALVSFAASGNVRWEIALPMAVCNVVGSQIGTRLALARGSGFVRQLFLTVVTALLVKLGWDAVHP
jgi:hypothetical protein